MGPNNGALHAQHRTSLYYRKIEKNASFIVVFNLGRVAERFKAPVSKTGIGETLSGVQIPPLPQRPEGGAKGDLKTF